jgi:3-phenylpropionate/cinnamic acid dioxygenase small subunit
MNISQLEYCLLRNEVEDLYTNYCEALDAAKIESWPDFFIDDCIYKVTTKDNIENNMPLCLIFCEKKGMLLDRTYAIKHTLVYRPRTQRRIVSGIKIKIVNAAKDNLIIEAITSFLLFESIENNPSQLLVFGRSEDVITRSQNILKFKNRLFVIDVTDIPESLVFPL